MDDESKKIEQTEVKLSTIVWVVISVFVVYILIAGLTYLLLPSWEERGALGDMFGTVNALFSGLAIIGVVFAILLQQRELTLQRAEMIRQNEAQEIIARLTAFSTLISHYDKLSENSEGIKRNKYQEKCENYVQGMSNLLDNIQSDNKV